LLCFAFALELMRVDSQRRFYKSLYYRDISQQSEQKSGRGPSERYIEQVHESLSLFGNELKRITNIPPDEPDV